MNFHLSDEQNALRTVVLRMADEAGDAGLRRRVFDGDTGFDRDFWNALGQLGVLSATIGAEHGGLGGSMVDAALIAEALGAAAAPAPVVSHLLAALAIQQGGDERQKSRWLPRLATGELVGSIAVLEEAEAWMPDAWRMDLDAGGRLTGRKFKAPAADIADVLVVGLRGGGLAIAPRGGGISYLPLDGADRTRRLCDVQFADAPAERLPGAAGARMIDAGLVLLAADAFGGAERLLEMTTAYVKERHQFGGPVGRYQGVKHQLANLAADIVPGRGLVWHAALAFDQTPEHASRIAAQANAHLTDRYMHAARIAVELHGGIGFTWEYGLQIWVKRAMFDFAYFGVPARLRARAAELAGW